VNKDLEQAEFKLKLAELTESLAEIKFKLVEVQEENLALRQEVAEAKRKQDLRSQLRVEGNVYVPSSGEVEGYGKRSVVHEVLRHVRSACDTAQEGFYGIQRLCQLQVRVPELQVVRKCAMMSQLRETCW